jgi:parallel beta-helix repeat protein
MKFWRIFLVVFLVTAPFGSSTHAEEKVVRFAPKPDIQFEVQEAFILAEPGTVIEFEEGRYDFTMGLSLDVDQVTIRGAGMDKTIFSFKNQDAGSEGLLVTSDRVTLEDFTIEDTKGNGMKSSEADFLTLRRVKAQWTGGPKSTNGGYGLYPVLSKNVLVEECVAIAASDAGIYLGQSENVVVRRCRAERNVAGIEIENCYKADVYENVATDNTAGILTFDMPNIPVQNGRHIRIYRNKVFDNNTPNFAPEGNVVAGVPSGTGVQVMGNRDVEIFENDIRDHNTVNLILASYFAYAVEHDDPKHDPYTEAVYIHHNNFGPGGADADPKAGFLDRLLGKPVPDIVWDGVVDKGKYPDAELPEERGIYVNENVKEGGEVTFANLGGAESVLDPEHPNAKRDAASHIGNLPPLEPVHLEGLE